MQKIPIDNMPEDSVCAAEVKDFHGRLIYPVGHVLTRPDIRKLQQWGVKEVLVQSNDNEAGHAMSREPLLRRLTALTERAKEHGNNTAILKLVEAERRCLQDKLEHPS